MKAKLLRVKRFNFDGMSRLLRPDQFRNTDDEQNDPEGMTIGYHGRRRKGKSLSMVGTAHMIHTDYDYPVLANFTLTFATGIPESNYPGLRSGRVNLEEMLNFPPEMHDCVLCLDEIDRWLLSKRSQSLVSEFLEYGLNQIGKRNIWLLWATQNIQRVNSHLFYHTDLAIYCDTNNHGRSVLWNMCDLNGAFGPPGVYRRTIFKNTEKYRKLYDTKEIFDPMERISVNMDRKHGKFELNEDWLNVPE